MYYVTMTDKFMSGWGMADGMTNRLIIECSTWEQARIIYNNAIKRPEMKRVRLTGAKPRSRKGTLISWKTWDDLGAIWKA